MGKRIWLLVLMSAWLTLEPVSAAERSIRVFTSKRITPLVERFYGRDDNAFATLFCNPASPQVMIVDGRLQDLDGKNFRFDSAEACEKARAQATNLAGKCEVRLVVDPSTWQARTQVSGCP